MLLQIAERSPKSKFYVIDAEDNENYTRFLDTNFQTVRDRMFVEWIDPSEWDHWTAALEKFIPKIGWNDWLVIDPQGQSWGAVEEWFHWKYYGRDIMGYYEDLRDKGNEARLDGFKEWTIIKAEYNKRMWKALRAVQGHVYMTTRKKQFGDKDRPDIKSMFGMFGGKPEGQAQLPYWPHTVLHAKAARGGEFVVNTVKDRGGRKMMVDTKMVNFALQYLVAAGNWTYEEESETMETVETEVSE